VIDDAHACLATVAEQFRIRLSSTHKAYGSLLELFKSDLASQSASGYLDIEAQDPPQEEKSQLLRTVSGR
jgi:hypothetical protein